MPKVVRWIPLKTMAALAVLKDFANGAIRRERVFRDREDLLAHGDWLISRFRFPRAILSGTVRRAAAGTGKQHRGQPIGTVSVNPEPSHASKVGQNYPHLNQVYQIPTMQLKRPTLKHNLQRDGFPNVLGAIDWSSLCANVDNPVCKAWNVLISLTFSLAHFCTRLLYEHVCCELHKNIGILLHSPWSRHCTMLPGRCDWLPTSPVYGTYLYECVTVHVRVQQVPTWMG